MTSGPFVVHGATLALVWFLAANACVSMVVAISSRRLMRNTDVWSPTFWLALRLLPAVSSAAFVALVFLPSYWLYEPREFVEGFDSELAGLALVALTLCAAGAIRGLLAWRGASARARAWLRLSQPMTIPAIPIPAYRVDIDTPFMALVGIVSPRLFVTRGVLEALTREELAAAVAHELGHWRAADNLKRLAMRAAPDFLTALRASRAVERRWASSAEHAADRHLADVVDGPAQKRARCALASALVKVARLMPPAAPIIEPISTLVDGGDIASRVHSLLEDPPAAEPPHSRMRWAFATVAGVAAVVLAYTPLLRSVHMLTEVIVSRF